jgi:tellurite resistance protein TerC
MHVTPVWWIGTLVLIIALLVVDLFISDRLARRKGRTSTRVAARWVAFYAVMALGFGLLVAHHFGSAYGGQFLAGWLTEYSLSVDNLFVFMVLMTHFAVPARLQLKVLTFGVVIALVLRGILITAGAVALEQFSWLFYLFGAFLVYTAWKMVRSDHGKEAGQALDEPPATPSADIEPDSGPVPVRLLNRLLPNTPVWHGTRLFVQQNNKWLVTPLLLTMLTIGFTDVLFALDSIPAIFGLTTQPFLVISANAFALIGLRQLFFVVRGLLDRLEHLGKGLSLVLAFIGGKLVLEALHGNSLPFINHGDPIKAVPEVSTALSLGVVVAIIVITALTSMISARRRKSAAARAQRETDDSRPEHVGSAASTPARAT